MLENEPTQNPFSEEGQGEKKSAGPLVGIITIVIVLVFGGLYFWGKQISEDSQRELQELPDASEITETLDDALEALKTQSTSDEIDAIESDLITTDLGNLDEELATIDSEFNEVEILNTQ